MAAELCDGFARLRAHRHIVDAAAFAPIALLCLGEQAYPETPGSQVGDLAVLGDVALVMRVARERQGGIGKREI